MKIYVNMSAEATFLGEKDANDKEIRFTLNKRADGKHAEIFRKEIMAKLEEALAYLGLPSA